MQVSAAELWEYDDLENRFVYTGPADLTDEFALRQSLTVADVFETLGLECPAGLRDAVVTLSRKEDETVDVPVERCDPRQPKGTPGIDTDAEGSDPRLFDGLYTWRPLAPSALDQSPVVGEEMGTPLVSLDTCLHVWKTWLERMVDAKHITPEHMDSFLADGETHLAYRGTLAAAHISWEDFDPSLTIFADTVVLCAFYFTYDFAENAFWAVYNNRAQEWSCHPSSKRIEEMYQEWLHQENAEAAPRGKAGSTAAGATIDFDTDFRANTVWGETVKRVVARQTPPVWCNTQEPVYRDVVWWPSEVRGLLSRSDPTDEWDGKLEIGQSEMEDFDASAVLEQVWNAEERPWAVPDDVQRWIDGASTLGKSPSWGGKATLGASHSSVRLKPRSSTRRSGSVLLTTKADGQLQSLLDFGDADQPPRPGSRGNVRAPQSPTWLSESSRLKQNMRFRPSSGNTSNVPPLIAVLRLRHGDEFIKALLPTMELATVDRPKPADVYMSFAHRILVVALKDKWYLHDVKPRVAAPHRVSVAALLASHQEEAREVSGLLGAISGHLPLATDGNLKQMKLADVTTSTMDAFRKGNIIASKAFLPCRPVSVDLLSRGGLANFEVIADTREVTMFAKGSRDRQCMIPPGMLEVIVGLSQHEETGTLCAMLRRISDDELVSARLRQFLCDCSDVRLVAAMAAVIEGNSHVSVCQTDPENSEKKLRADKQKRELTGLSLAIPFPSVVDPAAAFSGEGPGMFDVPMHQLQAPHPCHVIVAEVEHNSVAMRAGVRTGSLLTKVDGRRVATAAQAMKSLHASFHNSVVSITIENPKSPYAAWQACAGRHADEQYSTIAESHIVELAFQKRFLQHRVTEPFRVDAALPGYVAVVNPRGDAYYTADNLPPDVLAGLLQEIRPDARRTDWLRGAVVPGSSGTIVASLKSVHPLSRTDVSGTAIRGVPPRKDAAAAAAPEAGPAAPPAAAVQQPQQQLSPLQKEAAAEARARMAYPADSLTAVLRRFRAASAAAGDQPGQLLRKAAAKLVEAAWIETKHKRLGRSGRHVSLNSFALWYAAMGYKQSTGSLYYCLNLDAGSKLVVVHHTAITVKDSFLFDFETETRKTLIDSDPAKWMLDAIRRVEREPPASIGDEGVEVLAQAVSLCPAGVQHLSFEGNSLTDECIPHLVGVLVRNINIRSISVEMNKDVSHFSKRSLSCLIRCNTLECNLDHEDLDFTSVLEYTLQRREELFPADDYRILLVKNALGVLYHKAARIEDAERRFKEAWSLAEVRRTRYPSMEAALTLATILYNLGTLHLSNGNLKSGRDVFMRSFEALITCTGPKHPSVWLSLGKIADFHAEQRDFSKALFWYDFLSDELIASQGPRCPLVAEAKTRAADVHLKNGNTRLGLYNLLQALHVLRSQIRGDPRQMFGCMFKIGQAVALASPQKEWALHDQALHNIDDAFQAREVKLSVLAASVAHVASYYLEKADSLPPESGAEAYYERAARLFEVAVGHYEHLLSEKHPDFIELLLKWVAALVSRNRKEKRDEDLAFVKRMQLLTERTFGSSHPFSANAIRWMGRHHLNCGQVDAAAKHMQLALKLFGAEAAGAEADGGEGEKGPKRGAAGAARGLLAATLFDYGRICLRQRSFRAGETALLQCLRLRQAVHGREHTFVCVVLLALTELYSTMGRYMEAEDFAKRYITLFFSSFPESKHHVQHGLRTLSVIEKHQGKDSEAEVMLAIKDEIRTLDLKTLHGPMLPAITRSLRSQLKAVGALYGMKEVSWDARMQYIRTKALRSYPLQLIKALPPYNPLRRDVGVPLSSIEQALILQKMTGLDRLVRHARITDPGKPWTGILGLERAVMTVPEARDTRRYELNGAGDEEGEEGGIRPSMFGAMDCLPVWQEPSEASRHDFNQILDVFLFSNWTPTSDEDPIISSLDYVSVQLRIGLIRQREHISQALFADFHRITLRKLFWQLLNWTNKRKQLRDAERMPFSPDSAAGSNWHAGNMRPARAASLSNFSRHARAKK